MRIGLAVERLCARLRSRVLSSKLERMAGDLGPVSFRTPEFLNAELKLAVALAGLAEIEYEIGEAEAAERCYDRAEQIFTALRRFLPHADLDPVDREILERRMERLREAMARLSGLAMAA